MVDSTTDGAVSCGNPGRPDVERNAVRLLHRRERSRHLHRARLYRPLVVRPSLNPRRPAFDAGSAVCPDRGSCNKSGSVDTCTPGTYATDPKPGGGGVTRSSSRPGIYVFNGGLTLSGPIAVTGSGVFFYISGPGGKANLTPASMNITPPSSGPYQGILLFQARNNTTNTVVLG